MDSESRASALSRWKDGRRWRIGIDADVAWIRRSTAPGLAITAAIPPVFAAYATAVEYEPDQPDLHSFAAGLGRDYDAVLAGLTANHNSGAVEGNVNRIRMIKRQMYGPRRH